MGKARFIQSVYSMLLGSTQFNLSYLFYRQGWQSVQGILQIYCEWLELSDIFTSRKKTDKLSRITYKSHRWPLDHRLRSTIAPPLFV